MRFILVTWTILMQGGFPLCSFGMNICHMCWSIISGKNPPYFGLCRWNKKIHQFHRSFIPIQETGTFQVVSFTSISVRLKMFFDSHFFLRWVSSLVAGRWVMNIFNCLNPSPAVLSSVAVRIFREKSHLVSQVESEMKMSTYIYIYT